MTTTGEATLADIPHCVARALKEDIGTGDITALLIPQRQQAKAEIICRQPAVICGCAWVDEVFAQLDSSVQLHWLVQDGDTVEANQPLLTLSGNARVLLTGERTALNFLQLLSGTATLARHYATLSAQSEVKILDTRKTVPGLRLAQKYAVTVGGCHNHRIGLYDAFLIKENHIAACGGIALAVAKAREIAPEKPVEVEVETLDELNQALDASVDVVMLDNFSPEDMNRLNQLNLGTTKVEVSGDITHEKLDSYLHSAVSYISSGSLTKHVQAVDLSMRLVTSPYNDNTTVR